MINSKLLSTAITTLIASPFIAQAQEAVSAPTNQGSPYSMFYIVIILLVIVLLFQSVILRRFVKLTIELQYKIKHGTDMPVETYVEGHSEKSDFFSGIFKSLTRSVPQGSEKDMMLDHNYDGIRELDNRMPPWLQYIFFSSIGFAIIYFMLYQVYDIGKNPTQEYNAELQAAAIAKTERLKSVAASVDETSAVQLSDAASLSSGKGIFVAKCVACHGNNGEGNVGPNLTDDYWLHGGTINDIFKTVKYGVPAKGMVPWQGILKPEEIQIVASYIMSLHGSNPANAKAPQGVLFNAGTAANDSIVAVTDSSKTKI